ncbi:uncharacterized protein METZ01_LOCUS33951, partial [marine metagenome]
VVEFPALNRDHHDPIPPLLLTTRLEAIGSSFLPRLGRHRSSFALGEAPHAYGVYAAPELASDVSDLGEPPVLGHYVADLVHRSAPTEALVEMVENLHRVGGAPLLKKGTYLLAQAPSSRHQATSARTRPDASILLRRPAQLLGLTSTCAGAHAMGGQPSDELIKPAWLTRGPSLNPHSGVSVILKDDNTTIRQGSGRFL